jgi:hypothetical protein
MPESLLWLGKSLHFLHESHRLPLIVIISVLVIYTILYSNRFNKKTVSGFSLILLVLMGLAAFATAQNSEFIFAELNDDKIYPAFFSNLGAELVAGVLTVLILGFWTQKAPLLMPNCLIAATFIVAFIFLANSVLPIPFLQMHLKIDSAIPMNVGLEFLSLCGILVPIMFGSRIIFVLFGEHDTAIIPRIGFAAFEFAFAALFIIPNLLCILLLWKAGLAPENLLLTFFGSLASFLFIGSWIARNDVTTVILSCAVLTIIALLLLGAVKIPFDAATSISAELLGSLIIPIAIERNGANIDAKEHDS